jgi:hypothetical protein
MFLCGVGAGYIPPHFVIPSEAPKARSRGIPRSLRLFRAKDFPENYSHPPGAVKHLRQQEDHRVGLRPTSDPLQLSKVVSGDPSTPSLRSIPRDDTLPLEAGWAYSSACVIPNERLITAKHLAGCRLAGG